MPFKSLVLPLLAAAAVGVTLSVIAGREVSKFETRQVISDFQLEVRSRTQRLEREIEKNIEVVLSLKGLFEASPRVSREQFRAFAAPALARHPDIQALEWIPHVPVQERSAFEASSRQDGLTGYTVTEKGPEGDLVPAASRPEYFPVGYVEPLHGNEPAVGFDLASDWTRREALEKSRRSREPQATAPITLVQEREQQRGFLVFVPVFDRPSDAEDESDAVLEGFALGVFRIGAIVASEMFDSPEEAPGFAVSVFDASAEPAERLVFSRFTAEPRSTNSDIVIREPIGAVPGRLWRVEATPTKEYLSFRSEGHASIVLAAGLLLTLLLILYLVVSARKAVEITRLADALRAANDKLQRLATQDALTELPNRRRLSEALKQEWFRGTRLNSPVALLMIDVDHFKNFNDRYGHPAGDRCLRKLSEVLTATDKRSIDLVSRYGGEEFAVLLPDTDERGAAIVAERCREAVEALRLPHEDSDAGEFVTISVGVSAMVPTVGTTPEELVESADEALYAAKAAGRNCVFGYGRDRVSASRPA